MAELQGNVQNQLAIDEHHPGVKAKKVIQYGFDPSTGTPYVLDGAYNQFLFDPSDAQPNYIGKHRSESALTSDTGWVVFKFTYSGTATTKIQKLVGIWDNRTSIF